MKSYIIFLVLTSVSLITGIEEVGDETFGLSIGCLKHTLNTTDPLHRINTVGPPLSVDECLNSCLRELYRYGGMKNGSMCYCGSSYGSEGAGECPIMCADKPCGGNDSVSVYATGHVTPGPPKNITVYHVKDTAIGIKWVPPDAPNGLITNYTINAQYIETYATSSLVQTPMFTYPGDTTKAKLLGLHPATQYNISVTPYNKFGPGRSTFLLIWTQIGEPTTPEVPQVLRKEQGRIIVRLKPVVNDNGPVTAYRVVVSSDGGSFFEHSQLKSWSEAQNNSDPYYIAAELKPENLTENFVVGDGRRYGKYFNAPLQSSRDYHVSLGIVSSLHGNTKVSYAYATHSQHGVMILDIPVEDEDGESGLVLFLTVAIIISSILLIATVFAYFFIRHRLGRRRRRRRDLQELSLQGPIIEVENGGFINEEVIPEDEDERVDYYAKLHRQVWDIPRNFLDVHPDVIGKGKFGTVYKGTVQQRGFPVPATVYSIADGQLTDVEKRVMLQDLDLLIRCDSHNNIISLIGTCESLDTLYVVMEYHPATLKDMLLESRRLEHTADTGESETRFCSLSEKSLLQAVIGVARGMQFLTSKKIVHKKLAARNVIMVDGVTPKITGFGLADFVKNSKVPDYTRWTAQEIFRSRHYVSKSDVWSFGVLLWEMCALGGTPYSDVSSSEVPARVMRGLRLPHLAYVGDELYQLMLQCWQLDLDERPTFQEIITVLENILEGMELNFSMFTYFHYEPYIFDLECHS